MKKTLLTLATSLGLFFTLQNNALASCDGPYLAVRGGIANHTLGDKDENDITDRKLDAGDNMGMFSGALGYRHKYFRIEAEYIWRNDREHTTTSFVPRLIGGFRTSRRTEEFSSESYMANIYWDMSPYTMFTPYFSAGLGITKLEHNFKNSSNVGTTQTKKFEDDNFTWSVGGGLSAQVTTRFNIDLGYRYFDMGELESGSIHNHEVYGGLRYTF